MGRKIIWMVIYFRMVAFSRSKVCCLGVFSDAWKAPAAVGLGLRRPRHQRPLRMGGWVLGEERRGEERRGGAWERAMCLLRIPQPQQSKSLAPLLVPAGIPISLCLFVFLSFSLSLFLPFSSPPFLSFCLSRSLPLSVHPFPCLFFALRCSN